MTNNVLALICVTLFLFATNLIQLLVTRHAIDRATAAQQEMCRAWSAAQEATEEKGEAWRLVSERGHVLDALNAELAEEQRQHRNLLAKNQRKRDRVTVEET